MSITTSQMLHGVKEVLKDRIRGLLGIREEKDPRKLTEAERWVQSEIAYQKAQKAFWMHNCYGLHYSEWYLRSRPAEELYVQWQNEVEDLLQYIDDLVEQCKKKNEEERKAQEKKEKEKETKGKRRKRKAERQLETKLYSFPEKFISK